MPLTANIWRTGTGPPAPPAVTTPAQLRGPAIHTSGQQVLLVGGNQSWPWTPTLLMPALTDIRDQFVPGGAGDLVEVPAGSGRLYNVVLVEDVAKGFTNEHRLAAIQKTGIWPTPIP